ncbi:MAG: hypothetical protein ACC644_00405 [Candidatus Hydrothermarchaeales archaeon]
MKNKNPRIVNIVATGSFGRPLDIASLYTKLDVAERVYEPETYPALLVKVNVEGKKKHVTLYRNGKYIIAGVKSEEELQATFNEIKKKLQEAGAL